MRITSGNARGIWLNSPKGDSTRPATDAARQAIFSSIGDAIIGSRVLDIFAGTGAYGLEAASRGASEILFVESDKKALDALKSNVYAVERALRGRIVLNFCERNLGLSILFLRILRTRCSRTKNLWIEF